MAEQRVYTAAVVGGGAGGKLSLAALAASERFQPLAAADLRADVRAELAARYPGLRVFAWHAEMFQACPVDVVCVSTYPPSHQQVALDALKLPPRGILVEKPLGDTVAAGRAIVAAIRERNLPMVVPHGLLVARHCQEIFERVDRGEIGQLRLVEIECDKWDIINAGIHWLNFFVVLTRQAPIDYVLAACDATTRTYRDGMQVETLAVTYAQTIGGVRVVMQTGDYVKILPEGKSAVFRLVGTAGTIEFWAWESAYHILSAEHPHGLLVQVAPNPIAGHRAHLENLAESSLMALELCEAAYLSSRHGCAVRFPIERFAPPPASDWAPGRPYAGSGGGRDWRKLPAAEEAP